LGPIVNLKRCLIGSSCKNSLEEEGLFDHVLLQVYLNQTKELLFGEAAKFGPRKLSSPI
jgi:hypothetical protein